MVRIPKQKWWIMRCRYPSSYRITRSAIRITREFIPNCLLPIASKPTSPMARARNQRNMTLTTRPRCAKGSMLAKIFWNVCDLINAFTSSWPSPRSSFCCIRSTFLRRTDGECCIWLWKWCSVALPYSLCSWPPCGIPLNGMASCRANWQWKSHWKWVTWNVTITDNHASNEKSAIIIPKHSAAMLLLSLAYLGLTKAFLKQTTHTTSSWFSIYLISFIST